MSHYPSKQEPYTIGHSLIRSLHLTKIITHASNTRRPSRPNVAKLQLTISDHSFHAKVVLLQSVDQRNGELLVDLVIFGDKNESEVGMDATLDPVGPETQVDVPHAAHLGVVLKSVAMQLLQQQKK